MKEPSIDRAIKAAEQIADKVARAGLNLGFSEAFALIAAGYRNYSSMKALVRQVSKDVIAKKQQEHTSYEEELGRSALRRCQKLLPGERHTDYQFLEGYVVPRFLYRGHNEGISGQAWNKPFSGTTSKTRAAWYGGFVDVYEFIGGGVGVGDDVLSKSASIDDIAEGSSWTYYVSKELCEQATSGSKEPCDIFIVGSLKPYYPLGLDGKGRTYDHPMHWGDVSICNPKVLKYAGTLYRDEIEPDFIAKDFDLNDISFCSICMGATLCEAMAGHIDCECGNVRSRCGYCLKYNICESIFLMGDQRDVCENSFPSPDSCDVSCWEE